MISGILEGKVSGGLHDVFQFAYLAARSDEVQGMPLMSVKFDVDAGSEDVSLGTHIAFVLRNHPPLLMTSTLLGRRKEVQHL